MSNTILDFSPVTSSAVAYATGDTIGNNFMSITSNQFGAGQTNKLLQSVVLRDTSHVNMAIDLLLFNKAPVHTTTTDNARLQINALDINYLLNKISIASSDYADFNGSSVAVKNALAIPVVTSASGEIYGLLVARGTQTYSSTGEISLGLQFA